MVIIGLRDNDVQGISVDKKGNAYVADPLCRRIMVFDSKGKPIDMVNQVGPPKDQDGLILPTDVCIDQNLRMYVTDYGGSRLVIYDLKLL